MHEVTETASCTLSHLVLSAARLTKVSHRRQLGVDWTSIEPPVVQLSDGSFRILLAFKLDVNVADQMIAQVVTDIHLLDFAILVFELEEYLLKEFIIVRLDLFICHGYLRFVCRLRNVLRIQVKILHENCLTERRLVVQSGTSFTVSTGSDFEEKRTVDLVLLSPKN